MVAAIQNMREEAVDNYNRPHDAEHGENIAQSAMHIRGAKRIKRIDVYKQRSRFPPEKSDGKSDAQKQKRRRSEY